MKGSAESETAFVAAGMQVNHDAHLRENARLRGARAFAQLRNQDHTTGHLRRIKIMRQTLDRNLPFPFIAVRSSKNGGSRSPRRRVLQAVDHRERNQGVSPA